MTTPNSVPPAPSTEREEWREELVELLRRVHRETLLPLPEPGSFLPPQLYSMSDFYDVPTPKEPPNAHS